LVLAAGRRRRADIIGAVVIGLLQLGLYVAMGLTPSGGKISNAVGVFLLLPLFLGTPVHYLLMNQRRFWPEAKTPPPYPYPAYQPYPASAVTYPAANPYAGHPQALAQHPTLPGVPPTAATGAAELRELGELLRRQAGDGQP